MKYLLRICKDGNWAALVIDAFVPAMNKTPAYTHGATLENGEIVLWPYLVEKAYAKVCVLVFMDTELFCYTLSLICLLLRCVINVNCL